MQKGARERFRMRPHEQDRCPIGPPCDGSPETGHRRKDPHGEEPEGPSPNQGVTRPDYIQPRNDIRMPNAMIPRMIAMTLTFFLKSQ